MLRYVIIILASYLLGSLSMAVLLTRGREGGDVRSHGSGNAGATNVARVFGLGAGLLTLGGDMAKTALSGLIGWLLAGQTGLAVACVACLAGHCWPAYFGFRGGKGVSVAGCIAFLFDWRMGLIIVGWFLLSAVLSKRVSVGSLSAALIYPLSYWLLRHSADACLYASCVIAVTVIILHRSNIDRIIHGKEPVFKPKSTKK